MARKNPLYDGDPAAWDRLTLLARIEYIRRHLCTGPCGQSSQVLTQRERINIALLEVLVRLAKANED
jgi:hypothetical protein